MVSMQFTSLLEEVHSKMIRRLLFSSIVAAQFIAFSATGRDDAFRGQDLSSSGLSVAVLTAEDPLPCPDCAPDDPGGGDPDRLYSRNLAAMRAEDPLPCPDCAPDDPGGGDPDQRV